jgi:hypothetical protein
MFQDGRRNPGTKDCKGYPTPAEDELSGSECKQD